MIEVASGKIEGSSEYMRMRIERLHDIPMVWSISCLQVSLELGCDRVKLALASNFLLMERSFPRTGLSLRTDSRVWFIAKVCAVLFRRKYASLMSALPSRSFWCLHVVLFLEPKNLPA